MRSLTRSGLYRSDPAAELVPADLPVPAERHPAAVYLAGLAVGSRRTQRLALRVIARLLDAQATEVTLLWHRVEHAHVAAVRARLAETYAPATANRMLAAMRGVMRAAFRIGLIDAEHFARASDVPPVRGVRLPRGRALSKGELRALFEVCDANTNAGARDAGLLALLYGAGLRRSEAVALDLTDFDEENGTLVINGKGQKQRRAYVTNGSLDALQSWLQRRGGEPGPIFLAVNKADRIERRRLSDQTVAAIVHRLAERATIPSFSPHDMRRTFIGDMLDAGADLPTVQGLSGHQSPATTSKYDRRGERVRRQAAELLHVPFIGSRS